MKRSNVYRVLSPVAQKLPAVAGLGEGGGREGFLFVFRIFLLLTGDVRVSQTLPPLLLEPAPSSFSFPRFCRYLMSLTLAIFLFKRCDVLRGPYGFVLVPAAICSCDASSLPVLKSMTRLLWLESPFSICFGVGEGTQQNIPSGPHGPQNELGFGANPGPTLS